MKPDSVANSFKAVSIYATGEHPCAYLDDRTARTLFVDPREPVDNATYSSLVDQGFRRSGEFVYRPGCPGCNACVSIRIPVEDFAFKRRYRRCWKHNQDLEVIPVTPRFRQEHFALYRRYIDSRHEGSQMADPSPQQFMDFLTASWCQSVFYEFRADGQLVGVSAVDLLAQGLSAVYTFFDPEQSRRSLGTYAILWLLEEARRLRLPYVYLGYWIAESPKMRYKSDFRPHEIYDGRAWQRREPA